MVEVSDLSSVSSIHIVGAGGAGMSGLAKLLAQMGYAVSGSDLKEGPALSALGDLGIDVWTGSRPEIGEEVDLIVASSAIPERDIEVAGALAAGTDVWRRPELLRALTRLYTTIGATGTHGKTTSTGLMVAALRALGRDPSFVVGGHLLDLNMNAHRGDESRGGGDLVLEVDEAFGTFLGLDLSGLMVTNIEVDHLDHYETIDRLEDAFAEVAASVDGPVVIGIDDARSRRLSQRVECSTYGTEDGADYAISSVETSEWATQFDLSFEGEVVAVTVSRPGLHMARNATGVLALLHQLGHDVQAAAAGLEHFGGIRRRFELRGRFDGITVIDDYAHHPTEIAVTLEAAERGRWNRVLAVFQPHRYSRTAELFAEFGRVFSKADVVVVTDVYAAGEAPEPGVTGQLVADAIAAHSNPAVTYVPHRGDLAGTVAAMVQDGDLILTLGAGDITLLADEIGRVLT